MHIGMKFSSLARENRLGFSLIEILVVAAVVALLAALLFPAYMTARLHARIAKVHSDLNQIGLAIKMYRLDWKGLPPVRSSCMNNAQVDYYEVPRELTEYGYLDERVLVDPFNHTTDSQGKEGRKYKYVAINWGYSNNTKTEFGMWIPRDYPASKQECVLYYRRGARYYVLDNGKTYPDDPPVVWAVWSVGPRGDPGWIESANRMLPVPKKEWYPYNKKGVIVLLSDGHASP